MAKHGFLGNDPHRGTVLAETRGWVLFKIEVNGEWLAVKLVSKVIQAKGNYWLGWNGDRLACNRDAAILNTCHPDVYDWVVSILELMAA